MSFVRCATACALVVGLALVAGCARNERTEPVAEAPSNESPAVVPADIVEYIARGNEPFWAVNVTRAGIVFLEPERVDGVRGPYASPTRQGTTLVFRTVLRDSIDIPLELTLEERTCSDGMSDHTYTHAATARVGDRMFRGCAERRSVSPADSARGR